jgi:hypothetical protein
MTTNRVDSPAIIPTVPKTATTTTAIPMETRPMRPG